MVITNSSMYTIVEVSIRWLVDGSQLACDVETVAVVRIFSFGRTRVEIRERVPLIHVCSVDRGVVNIGVNATIDSDVRTGARR
jgi:hypothetical protein